MLKNAMIMANIPASDMQRARKFYEETIGLSPMTDMGGAVVYECGNASRVVVYQSGGAGTNKATTANWSVADLDAEMNDLRAKGVIFEEYDMPGIKTENGIATSGNTKAAWFKDTEGNILGITQQL